MTALTRHFSADEIGAPPDLLRNATITACAAECIRRCFGETTAINVTRGYSTVEHNAAVQGEPDSYHLIALALDFHVADFTDAQAMAVIAGNAGRIEGLVRKVILDLRPGHAHLHMECWHPECGDMGPCKFLTEDEHGFRVWAP